MILESRRSWPAAWRHLLWTLGAALLAVPVQAQSLPPIFKDTPRQIAPARVVAEFPRRTFLENLVVEADGSLIVTSHEDGRVLRIREGQAPAVVAQLPGKVAGVAADGNGGLVVTGADASGKPVVHLVAAGGSPVRSIAVPDAIFLNGIERVAAARYLIADSYGGRIWLLDAAALRVTVWVESPLLQRADPQNPIPAANGLRRDGSDLIVSNTARMTLVRIPLRADGTAGTPAVWKEGVNVDDFAVLPDRSLVAATHIYDSVIRIDRDGAVRVLGEAAQGLTGSTAVALSADGSTVYVTTNGGMFLPPPTGVQPAKVIGLRIAR